MSSKRWCVCGHRETEHKLLSGPIVEGKPHPRGRCRHAVKGGAGSRCECHAFTEAHPFPKLAEKLAELRSTTGHAVDPAGVDHPAHYNAHPAGVECIDVIEHFPHNVGAAIKYLWRAGLKAGEASTKDLRKAAWYSEREAKRLEKKAGER